MNRNDFLRDVTKGFLRENPVFVLLLGMCPTLGVTTSAFNGLGMGLATTVVVICSNSVISPIRNLIPDKVRIPAFIVIIASFVTIIDMTMAAYFPNLHEQLGLFIPLIVVNCIVLGRAEAFASKKGPLQSMLDGLSMGLGFAFALTLLGATREILGSGSLFDIRLLSENATTMLIFVMPPGAFIALGFIIATVNRMTRKKASAAPHSSCAGCRGCALLRPETEKPSS